MRIDLRYHMQCGPEGDWRLREEHLRRQANVYRTQVDPNPVAHGYDTPLVSLVTMGEPRRVDRLAAQRHFKTRPLSWIKRMMTPHKLRSAETKSIAARGQV